MIYDMCFSMKKKLTLFIFLTSLSLYSQSAKKRLARGRTFYKLIRAREVLDTMLWKKEAEIFDNTERFFKNHHLDPDNGSDYEFFQSGMMQQFLFSKRHILDRIKYQYNHKPYEDLGNWIEQIKKGHRNEVIFSSGLYDNLNKLLVEEMQAIKTQMVPKYLDIIVKKHRPVDLKLTYNGRPVKASDLDIDVVLETKNADYQRVSILDKKNNRLLKPEGYTYDQIIQLHIIFKGKEFDFKPDENIFVLPHNLMEVNNFISRYSFEEIPVWEIHIVETSRSTGIKLVNVVEANVVKTKSTADKPVKKFYK